MGVRFPPRAPRSFTTVVRSSHLCPRIRRFCNLRSPSFTTAGAGDVPMFYGYDSGYVLPPGRRVSMLTALGIEKLKPKGKPYKVSDGNALYVLVKPTGGKHWRLRYTFGGKEKMLSLGSFPEVLLADARAKRDDAHKLLGNGIDPSDQKKQDK